MVQNARKEQEKKQKLQKNRNCFANRKRQIKENSNLV